MKSYNPFRDIAKRVFSQESLQQLVPDVTDDDVFRIVRRDFPRNVDSAILVLGEYGTESSHREHTRVRMAALKLAEGNLEALKQAVRAAKQDFRDIVAAAEYPSYSRAQRQTGSDGFSRKEKQRIIAADWSQYQEWLRRT